MGKGNRSIKIKTVDQFKRFTRRDRKTWAYMKRLEARLNNDFKIALEKDYGKEEKSQA